MVLTTLNRTATAYMMARTGSTHDTMAMILKMTRVTNVTENGEVTEGTNTHKKKTTRIIPRAS